MLTRRDFLKGTMATLILVPIAACSDDDSPTGTGDPGGSTGCTGVESTGSNSSGHVHTVCVPESDLTSPPSGGQTYTTSNDGGHTHTVTLSQTHLQSIESGGTVNVTSSGPGHTHNFAIEKSP